MVLGHYQSHFARFCCFFVMGGSGDCGYDGFGDYDYDGGSGYDGVGGCVFLLLYFIGL